MSSNINVRQPHLKEQQPVYNPGENMSHITVGRVISYNSSTHTASVYLLKSGGTLGVNSDLSTGGVPISVSNAGYDTNSMCSYGTKDPLMPGQIVLVAFMEGKKQFPVILGSLHDWANSEKNILDANNLNGYADKMKYVKVFPSQAYMKVDGFGGVEFSHPSKSFFKMTLDDISKDFDHSDLTEYDPRTGEVYSASNIDSAIPVSVIFCHRSFEGTGGRTKVFISKSGELSIIREVDGKEKPTEIVVGDDGRIKMTHHSGSYITFEDNGDIRISAQNKIIYSENG